MAGSPALSFTIPSILDDTTLDARVYVPERFQTLPRSSSWRKKVAIVAHPYAPMASSYDDLVVILAASAMLKQGFIVGTFNFRGAGSSKGHTTLTSKGETYDYISIIGFMTYFIHHLEQPPDILFEPPVTTAEVESLDLSTIQSQIILPPSPANQNNNDLSTSKPVLIIGGYSYGSVILRQLSNINDLLTQFVAPELGTAAAEIRLRAHDLAKQQSESLKSYAISQEKSLESKNSAWRYSRGRTNPAKNAASTPMLSVPSTVRIGGEETHPDFRRASSDSHGRRSFSADTPERIRKSMDKVRSMGRPSYGSPRRHQSSYSSSDQRQFRTDDESPPQDPGSTTDVGDSTDTDSPAQKVSHLEVDEFKVCYLLISPPLGLVSSLIAWSTFMSNLKSMFTSANVSDSEIKLAANDTLAILGGSDGLVSVKSQRQWATRLSNLENSHFRYIEISGAGHFWHERGVGAKLSAAVTSFVGEL